MNQRTKQISILALVISLSVWIGSFERYFNFGGIQIGLCFVPILIFQDFYGLKSGILCLLCYNAIKTIFLSKSGILGFLNRASIIFYMAFRKNYPKKIINIVLYDILGLFFFILSKIPTSYIFWKSSSNFENYKLFDIITRFIIPTNLINLSVIILVSRIMNFRKFNRLG